jgi:hypothetical protein
MTAKSRTTKKAYNATTPRKSKTWRAKPSRKVATTSRRMTTRRTPRRRKW